MYPWLCVSLLVPYSLGDHSQLGGGNVAKRLMSTLAYGWVKHCSNVALSGQYSFKIIISCVKSLYLYLIYKYDEHVNVLNEM